MTDYNTAALMSYEAQEAAADEREARLDAAADFHQEDFEDKASEQQHENYGLDGELFTHCNAEIMRIITYQLGKPWGHPYNQPGGTQLALDDRDTIQQHINVWHEERVEELKEEFKQTAIDTGEY